MSIQLPAPITVRVGIAQAACTHIQFGATLQRWNTPPAITYCVMGIEEGGVFTPAEGVRQDTGEPAIETALWAVEDYDWFVGKPAVQEALALLKARHDWIVAGRPEGQGPA